MSLRLPRRRGEPPVQRIVVEVAQPKAGPVDVWIQRGGHLAQLGILVATVWTVLYTVVPLYQKALLDEEIARKEVQLQQTEAALEDVYSRLRHSTVASFLLHAGARCSGLLDEVMADTAEAANRPRHSRFLDRPFRPCILDEFGASQALRLLNPADLVALQSELESAISDIEAVRLSAQNEVKMIPQRVRDEPDSLAQPLPFTRNLLRHFESTLSPADYNDKLMAARIDAEEVRIVDAYWDFVRERMSSISEVLQVVPAPASTGRPAGP